MRTIVYCRVSSREQGDSGLGLEAQRTRCLGEVASRGWQLLFVAEEVASAGAMGRQRPKLESALRMLDVGQADALIVLRLDRLSRSLPDFADVLRRASTHGWKLVVLDPALDMSSPSGELVATMLMAFAQWERRMASIRTKEGLEVARARGSKIGQDPYSDEPTIRRIMRWHKDGETYSSIARLLTDAGVPSPFGRRPGTTEPCPASSRGAKSRA